MSHRQHITTNDTVAMILNLENRRLGTVWIGQRDALDGLKLAIIVEIRWWSRGH